MRFWLIALAVSTMADAPARALDLVLPGNASLTGEVLRNPDSYMLPTAPFAEGALPVDEIEGRVLQRAWRIDQSGMTTLQMIRPLREQLEQAGYDITLDCGGQECGGFDFRFNTRVLAAPDMYVDLFDFRFLSARMQGTADSAVSVMVSQSGGAGYIQIIQVTADGSAGVPEVEMDIEIEEPSPAPAPSDSAPVIKSLTEQGHVILKDLDFGTGSSALGKGPHSSLEVLAEFLLANRSRRIALVGHTDRMGSLESNVALSRRRANSVLERLAVTHGVPRGQLEANGVGYLSPIAPNTTAEGREANRRVEAVLLNME